jgi:hypothetical protein
LGAGRGDHGPVSGAAREALGRALGAMRLSEMEPALLTFAIADLATEMGSYSPLFRDALMLAAYVHRTDRRGARNDLPRDAP